MLINLIYQIYIPFELTLNNLKTNESFFLQNIYLNKTFGDISSLKFVFVNLSSLTINSLLLVLNFIFSSYLFLNQIFAELLIFLMERTEITPSNIRTNNFNNHESKYNYVIDYFNDKTPKKSDKSWFERFIRIPLESFLIKLGFLDEKNSFSYITKKRSEENFRSLWIQNSDIYVESKVDFAKNFEVVLANRLGIASVEEIEAASAEEIEAASAEEIEAASAEEIEAAPAEEIEAAPAEEIQLTTFRERNRDIPVEAINTRSYRSNPEFQAIMFHISDLNPFRLYVSFQRFQQINTWSVLEESMINSLQEMSTFVSEQKTEILQLKQLRENFVKTKDENSELHRRLLFMVDQYIECAEKFHKDCKAFFEHLQDVFSLTRNDDKLSDYLKCRRVKASLHFFTDMTKVAMTKKEGVLRTFCTIFSQ